jgi:hypothetical protein
LTGKSVRRGRPARERPNGVARAATGIARFDQITDWRTLSALLESPGELPLHFLVRRALYAQQRIVGEGWQDCAYTFFVETHT